MLTLKKEKRKKGQKPNPTDNFYLSNINLCRNETLLLNQHYEATLPSAKDVGIQKFNLESDSRTKL